jgi:hypothetical protein
MPGELEAALALIRTATAGEALISDQGRGLVDIIARYTQTFLLLQRYDEGLLTELHDILGGTNLRKLGGRSNAESAPRTRVLQRSLD